MQIFAQCIMIDLCFGLSSKSSFVAYFSLGWVSQITCLLVANCSVKRNNYQCVMRLPAITLQHSSRLSNLIIERESKERRTTYLYLFFFSYLQMGSLSLYIGNLESIGEIMWHFSCDKFQSKPRHGDTYSYVSIFVHDK